MTRKIKKLIASAMLCTSIFSSGISAFASELPELVIENESQYAVNNPNEEDTHFKSLRAAGWHQDSTGWWYEKEDGSYAQNEWLYINNYWYYFNNDGYMLQGWQYINNEWYYLNPGDQSGYPSGAMVTGIVTIHHDKYGNNEFGFDSDGKLFYTKLGINRVQEEDDKWCWIGSIKAIGDYMNPGNGISQSDICLYVKNEIVSAGGNSEEVKTGLSYITGQETEAYYPFSMETTADKLMNYQPFVIATHYDYNNKTYGHAITGIGYNETANSIYFMDADSINTSKDHSFDRDQAVSVGFVYPGTSINLIYKYAVSTK